MTPRGDPDGPARRRAAAPSLVALVLLALLSACAGMHSSDRTPPQSDAAARKEATLASTPPDASASQDDNARPQSSNETQSNDTHPGTPAGAASNEQPTCTCTVAEPKPKRKPRPKREHKEAPPQLPTAPIVAETPPGGLVNAEIRSMNVAVMSILGKRVRGPGGEDMGRVVDVLADATGRVRIAIIDFGGFLGVGAHRIAVDWPLLRFNPDGSDPSLLLSLSMAKLRAAPEYKDNPRPQILSEPAPSTVAPAPPPEDGKK